ncbi:hypothetical protein CY652_13125 [Burkholderia sp. WAC0059]|uniref:hypothetical protein n=1 Tax=Burkholderia sp. WAC0059 TaxID=2066022 RepID=UPI000C7F36F3|nr:hypothetical protein [Burkholderia sp. WAC0059]PLZ01966.1 hypothetical protein CY652_13125 [Burkholderia sp. WAC0059]
MQTPVPPAQLVAKARTGFTRDGRVTVESTELQRIAQEAGCRVGRHARLSHAMKALGAERIANGHEGVRYAFSIPTIAHIREQFKDQ